MEVVKNLIDAIGKYAHECSWLDSEIAEAIVSMGITKADFVKCGYDAEWWDENATYFE